MTGARRTKRFIWCALALSILLLPDAVRAQSDAGDPSYPENAMSRKILVHVTHGPEHPTRAALAFAVAKAAIDEGHSVSIFLAGDAVQLIRDDVLASLNGLGTGNMQEFYDAIVAGSGRFYVSGGSSKARGVTAADMAGKPAEFAGPPELVRLSLEHDRMFTY